MTIDELLDIMDETLEEATTLPFTGGKRMVDVEKVRDIMDDIRLSMPQEIKQARAIVEDRGRIVDDANKEAEAIIKRAEERARAIVAEQAIVKAAQQKATEMLASAQAQSREMRATVGPLPLSPPEYGIACCLPLDNLERTLRSPTFLFRPLLFRRVLLNQNLQGIARHFDGLFHIHKRHDGSCAAAADGRNDEQGSRLHL